MAGQEVSSDLDDHCPRLEGAATRDLSAACDDRLRAAAMAVLYWGYWCCGSLVKSLHCGDLLAHLVRKYLADALGSVSGDCFGFGARDALLSVEVPQAAWM